MTEGELRSPPAASHGGRWSTAVASLAVGVAFFSLWFWLLPRWLGFSVETAGASRWRWLAAVPSVLGFAVALRGISGGREAARLPQSLRRSGWSWWVSTATCGIPCTWASRQAGSGCGSCSDTPIRQPSLPWRPLPSVCICLWSFMKSRRCARSSGRSTKSIVETCVAGGCVCGAGISRNEARVVNLGEQPRADCILSSSR